MRKVNKLDIAKALIRVLLHYPESGHDPESIEVIADDYYDAFSGYDAEAFNRAATMAIRRCKFFPKIANIAEFIEITRQDIELERRFDQITEGSSYKSAFDIANAKSKLKKLLDSITRRA